MPYTLRTTGCASFSISWRKYKKKLAQIDVRTYIMELRGHEERLALGACSSAKSCGPALKRLLSSFHKKQGHHYGKGKKSESSSKEESSS
jgi:hypothetical protein